ncbi:ethanolamine kinase 2 isoform X2 [Dendropsophus ebraccatus]|uniref:ethanolamine kinase 2 isoform X2 n=1 Tax=Dendropsophus ebraccatus TaxID=150705 RepID=UPI003831D79B
MAVPQSFIVLSKMDSAMSSCMAWHWDESILIAHEMAKYHCIPAHNGCLPKAVLWQKLNKYLSILHTEEGRQDRLLAEIPSLKVLEEELIWLQKYLPSLESPIVLCHNDLLCKNVIYNEEEGHVRFIDYEYAGYNYQAYDIANHFNEFSGVIEPDYRLFPDRETQRDWLRHYLGACRRLRGEAGEPQDKEVDDLCIQVNKFVLASHYFWGLWALIQHRFSDIDFNFAKYAMLRFRQYFQVKPQVTALRSVK